MDFTNEINTLESEKLRLEEMLKRNNDRLQLLKEASTEPSSDGYRRFFKLKGYSLLYTGGERLNHERFIFNCTLVSTAGHLSRKYWNVEELSKKLEGAKEISKEEFIKLWHLKRDVLTFQRVICLARNRTFREEDYSPLLNLFLKWQKTI